MQPALELPVWLLLERTNSPGLHHVFRAQCLAEHGMDNKMCAKLVLDSLVDLILVISCVISPDGGSAPLPYQGVRSSHGSVPMP